MEICLMTSNVLGNWNAGFIENRDDCMAEIYLEYSPDVIALQEVSGRYRNQSTNLFSLVFEKYKEIEVPATNRSHNNSTPLIYLKNRFSIKDRGYHFFADGVCDNSKSISWALFQDKSCGKSFLYASTHFIHNSEDGRIVDGDQLKLICDGLVAFYNCPMFIGGDFNCGKKMKEYQHLRSLGFIDLYDCISDATTARSFHPYPVWNKEENAYRPNPQQGSGDYLDSIDHIFYYGKSEHLPQVQYYGMVTDERAKIASDHYPVYVRLTITEAIDNLD